MSENENSSGKTGLFERFVPILLLLSVGLAFMVGVLWQKVTTLEKGGSGSKAPTANTGTNQGDLSGKLSADQAKNLPTLSDKDHIRGSKDAQVIIVEYSDLQCPFCDQFHPTMEQAVKEYGNKIAWVYRHFPLDTIHPRARPAANAAECVAGLAGGDAFWKFVDTIFSNQDKYLTDSGLAEAAAVSGAGKTDFASCYKAQKYESIVEADYQGGVTAGVTGTPANFVINKKGEIWMVPGAVPFDSLKATIDEALK